MLPALNVQAFVKRRAKCEAAFHPYTLTGLSDKKRSSYTSLTLLSLLYVTVQSKEWM